MRSDKEDRVEQGTQTMGMSLVLFRRQHVFPSVMQIRFCCLLASLFCTDLKLHAQQPPYAPTSSYVKQTIQGFTVLIHPEVLRHEQDAQQMRLELESQLKTILQVVPARPMEQLKKVRFWVEWAKKPNGGAEFHVSRGWLSANGYNPEKAGDIELSHTRNFVKWSRAEQPCMVLHELAHAYHHLVLGDKHEGIKSAFQQAVDRKLYESIAYVNGGTRKAYALTNAKEYYAELTEAYFGKNDFYPFNRNDLARHDPVGYRLIESTWGVPDAGKK